VVFHNAHKLEGNIIKAVVSKGRPLSWSEIHQETNTDEGQLMTHFQIFSLRKQFGRLRRLFWFSEKEKEE